MGVDLACLVCLKVVRKSKNQFYSIHESLFRKFVLISERLFGLHETFVSTFSWTTSRTTGRFLCPDCEAVIRDTCKLYQDLSAVQLKLGWKLKHLQASIRSHNQLSPKLRTVLYSRVAKQLELPGGPEQVRDIHRQISRHCCRVAGSQREVSIPLERIPDATGKATGFLIPEVPDQNFATDVIKVENEIAMAARDEDESFSNFDYTQEVDLTADPACFKGEVVNQQASPDANRDLLVAAKLQSRKAAICYSQRNIYQHLKSIKKAKRKEPARRKAQPCSTTTNYSTDPQTKKKKKPTTNIPAHLWYVDDGRDPSELTCRICTKKSYVPNCLRRLRTHLRGHENRWRKRNPSERPPLQCYFCFWAFKYDQSLQVHLETYQHVLQLSKGKFICSEGNCDNIEFRTFPDFNTHFESGHPNQALFRCDLCSWPFLNDEMRQVHRLVHQKVKWGDFYDCPKCGEKKGKSALGAQHHYIVEHTTIASEELLVYSCPVCTVKCKYLDSFEAHMKTHKRGSDRDKGVLVTDASFPCEHCGRSFSSRRRLNTHRWGHKKTQCPKCGKIVTNLTPHLREFHKEGEPIPCPECGKVFTSKKGIKQHLFKVHNPERPRVNPCPICPKVYQRLPLLNVHLRDVHQIVVEALQAPPKFICPNCGKGYFNKSSLDSHVITKHTEESERK